MMSELGGACSLQFTASSVSLLDHFCSLETGANISLQPSKWSDRGLSVHVSVGLSKLMLPSQRP